MTIVWSWDGHIGNGAPRCQVCVDLALGRGVRLTNEFGRGHWPVADATERWLTSGVAMGLGKKPMPFGKLFARNYHPARSAR